MNNQPAKQKIFTENDYIIESNKKKTYSSRSTATIKHCSANQNYFRNKRGGV